MSRSLRFSRWRRLPGAHRILDRRLPTHATTIQRFTVYLPGRVIEDADVLARLEGDDHAQAYCERILIEMIDAEVERVKAETAPPEPVADEDLDAMADDCAAARPASRGPLVLSLPDEGPADSRRGMLPAPQAIDDVATVLRHAGRGPGVLGSLRRGETPDSTDTHELMSALQRLDAATSRASPIDRPLAHALFRLSLESRILLGEIWPHFAGDAAIVRLIHGVQELSERILAGGAPEPVAESSP